MNKSEILAFLNTNPVFHLATLDGDKPRVRGMLLYRADEKGILFHTGKMRDLCKQLTANPHVELSFNNGSAENLIQVRISGTVELVEDLELKKEIVQNRDFLKPFVEQAGYDPLAVYAIKDGMASIWRMQTNLAPKKYVEL
ncbi:MAG: pyridoxamine 5'-phosphate oxidase family protein [Nitrospiraceae bacterium]|nr:pyridoxamine 5'-phosphate oxidase family protein [Nitrospiraceae bacterium]